MQDLAATPPHSDNDLDFGPTLRGMRAGMKLFAKRYTLVRQLGRGGMGVVWLAQDGRLDREVALKFLPESVQGDPVAVDELKRETKRCLELTHPNIVRIFDFEQEDNSAAIAMEYVDGQTLSGMRLQRPNRVFEVDEILPWLQTAIAALHYAHTEAKMVHRDLKPANFMLDLSGKLKLADFGIACRIGDSFSRLSRGTNAAGAGTLVYMSPQQMMGFPPSVADDIYSIGATLYELLTGRPPFHSGSIERQIEAIVPPSMTDRRAELEVASTAVIPESWELAVAACLEKDAARRPQSATEILQRIAGTYAAAALEAKATAPALPVKSAAPVQTGPVSTPPGRSGGWLKIAAAFVFIGLAWAAYHFGYGSTKEKETLKLAAENATATSAAQLQKQQEDEMRQRAEQSARDKQTAMQAELDRQKLAEEEAQRQKTAMEELRRKEEASRPKMLKVPGEYASIQSALDAAKEGDTVMVGEGIYRESLEFKSGVRLLGVNAGSCRIQPPPGAMCAIFALNCTSGSIENLTVEGGGTQVEKIINGGWKVGTPPNDKTIASVEAGGIAQQAGLRPGDSAPVKVNGQPINALSYLATLRGNMATSLQLELGDGRKLEFVPQLATATKESWFPDGIVMIQSRLSVRKCILERLGGTALIAENSSELEAEENTISDNIQNGININSSTGQLSNNNISRNKQNGILFFNSASGTLEDNTISDNTWCGIVLQSVSSATLENNTMSGNKQHGIVVDDSAPKIHRNKIYKNEYSGLYTCKCSKSFLVSDNIFTENSDGITIKDSSASVTVQNNECRNNKNDGIYFAKDTRGTVSDNTCTGSQRGITIEGGHMSILNNTCNDNAIGGVFVTEGTTGIIKGNSCDRNSSGIFARGKSTKVEIVDNRASNNKRNGFVVETVCVPVRFDNNTGSGNKEGLSSRSATWSK